MMLAVSLQRLIAAKAVRVIDAALPRMLFDVAHQLRGGDVLHHPRVNAPVPLQQPENKTFSGGAAPALALAPPAEVRLVEFDLAAQATGFEFRRVVKRLPQVLVDA